MQPVSVERLSYDAAPSSPPSANVMLVDDSRLQRRILRATLQKSGYQVTECASAQEALVQCEANRPDIVISDWMMPGMDGIEFCRAFRDLPGDRYSYFILLTSKSEKDEVARGLESGADDFVTKPVNGHELRARIRAGERILAMQSELREKNRVISDTLTQLQVVHDRLDKDLIEAEKLQMSLLPSTFGDWPTGSIAAHLRSSGHVGGDLVGFYTIDDHRRGLFSIDVSGHGISSALLTARLAGYLSSSPEQNVALEPDPAGGYRHLPPNEVIATLNRITLDDMETELYFTMLLAELDLETGEIVMSQAGHPHPVIQHADGRITQTGPGGLPVGLIDGAEYPLFTFTLRGGDRLLMFSDGVTECPGHSGGMLGEEGLEQMLSAMKDVPTEAVFDRLLLDMTDYAGTSQFPDDVSGLVFQFDPQAS